MKKCWRIVISGFLAGAVIIGCTGCNSKTAEVDNHVTVSLYDIKLLGEYTEYVESQVPEADIEWNVGKNTLDFYTYLQRQDDLPDIMTSRRFSLIDARPLKNDMLDLSGTELAASYHSVYLDKYRNEDNTVNWLPAPGIFDNLVANQKLFDEYGIPIPTDYGSFVSACLEFESKGIRGFISDYAYDYTAMEILQGLSVEALSSLEGRTWRHDYENKAVIGLDDVVWPSAFGQVQELVEKGILKPEDAALDYYDVHEAFIHDQAAMIRGTGAIAMESVEIDRMDVTALPYLGTTGEENWALTYPVFQAAVSHSAGEEENHKKLTLKVLNAMLDKDAQMILNHTIGAQISYNKDIELPLPKEMERMRALIEKNHIYIRIASNEFFQTSLEVFSNMLSGQYDGEQAYRAFDQMLTRPDDIPGDMLTKFDAGYSSHWDRKKGNAAGSSIANTVREALGADVVIFPFFCVNCGIFTGDQTEQEAGFPVQNHGIVIKQITGAELITFLRALVEETGQEHQLPVVSGVEMHITRSDHGLSLESVTVQGREISSGDVLTLIYSNKSGPEMNQILQIIGGKESFTQLEGKTLQSVWLEYLEEGNMPLIPSEYVVFGK